MKTHVIYGLIILVAGVLDATMCIGQSNVVFYGANSTNTLNVTFEDTGLSAAEKSVITVELRMCLKDWGGAKGKSRV